MAKMSLAKLLKYKKRVAERLAKIDEQIKTNNSVLVGNTREYDPLELLKLRNDVVDHLLQVKVAQAEANVGILSAILAIGELKGQITLLQSLETKHGKHVVGYSDTTQEYEATIKASDVDKRVRALQSLLDATQESIDAYNYSTTVTIPDATKVWALDPVEV